MRGALQIEARSRLRRVVDHIDANAEKMPSVADLAALAELSPFHFIRFYKKYTGETPGETALRLRLARARIRLAAGDAVSNVAFSTGYGSVQAFSHAFQRVYRQTPSRVPRGVGLPSVPPRLEWLIERPAAGLSFQGLARDAVGVFDRVIVAFRSSGQKIQASDVFGLVYGDPFVQSDVPIRLDAVVATSSACPRGLERMSIPGGLHVVMRSLGPLLMAGPGLRRLIQQTLPFRGLVAAGGPVLCCPLRDPATTPPSERIWEILVPAQRARMTG